MGHGGGCRTRDDYEDPENIEDLLSRLDKPEQEQEQQEGEGQGEQPYQSPQDVEYRGEFKPELVQLLEEMKEAQRQANEGEAPQLTREMLEELLAQSAELEQGGDYDLDASATAKNLMREVGMKLPPKEAAQGQGPFIHIEDEGRAAGGQGAPHQRLRRVGLPRRRLPPQVVRRP